MFRRLPDVGGETVTFTIDGPSVHRSAGRHGRGGLLAAGVDQLPDDARVGRAARALLHDGRVLRVPRHDRWHRQPPRLPDPRRGRHA